MPKVTRAFLQGRPVVVALRGGAEIECQCPDPAAMIHDVFPLATFAPVLEVLAAWFEDRSGPSVDEATQQKPIVWIDFTDKWACAAALAPRIVRPGEPADGVSTISVDELDMDDKVEIFRQTNRHFKGATRLRDALEAFRRDPALLAS